MIGWRDVPDDMALIKRQALFVCRVDQFGVELLDEHFFDEVKVKAIGIQCGYEHDGVADGASIVAGIPA